MGTHCYAGARQAVPGIRADPSPGRPRPHDREELWIAPPSVYIGVTRASGVGCRASQGIAPSLGDEGVTPDTAIEASRRIGITKGVDLLWRFTLTKRSLPVAEMNE